MSEPRTPAASIGKPTHAERGLIESGAAISDRERGIRIPVVVTSDTAPALRRSPRLVIDTRAAPDLEPVADKFRALFDTHFDTLAALLQAPGQVIPDQISVVFAVGIDVADTHGATLRVSVKWFRDHPDDLGVFIHELSHVLQAYPSREPAWLTEGIADYARAAASIDDPKVWSLPKLTAGDRYDQGYGVTAAFLTWAEIMHPGLVANLNLAMKQKHYTPLLWVKHTGKSVDDLWLQCLGAAK